MEVGGRAPLTERLGAFLDALGDLSKGKILGRTGTGSGNEEGGFALFFGERYVNRPAFLVAFFLVGFLLGVPREIMDVSRPAT